MYLAKNIFATPADIASHDIVAFFLAWILTCLHNNINSNRSVMCYIKFAT